MESQNFKKENINEESERLWSLPFIFLNLSFFFVFMNIAFFYLYPLALDAMGSKTHVIGLVMGAFSIAAVISRPSLGKLVSLKGESRVMSLGVMVCFFGSLGYNLITDFVPGMLLIRVIHGIGFSAFISGGFSFAAKTFHPDKRGEAFGILGAALMGAVSLAPPFGEFLIRQWGFHGLYLAAAGALILAWFATFIAINPLPPSTKKGDNKFIVRYLPLLKKRSFLFLLCSTFIFAHCQATVPNFLALIASEKGINSGPFFFSSYFSAILILLTMGRFIDRYGKLFFLKFAYPLFAIGIFLIPQMLSASFLSFPAIVYGVGIGLLFPAHNALAAGHGDRNEKPAIMSLFTTVYDTGFITGTVISGWIAYQTSLEMLFWSCGIFCLIGFLTVMTAPIKDN